MKNNFVPTDVNRVPITGVEAPDTTPNNYLSEYRLIEIRRKASANIVNEVPAMALNAADVLALIDELYALRRVAPPARPRASLWRRIWNWIGGQQS